MATQFTRSADGGYAITDTQTGTTATYATEREFQSACLVEILRRNEEVQAGLARLQGIYAHRTWQTAEVAS